MNQDKIRNQLESLRNAIAEGALEIEFQGKKVKYRSLDEMRRIELSLVGQLNNKNQSLFKKTVMVFEKF